MNRKILAGIALTLGVAGCIPSLYPLYTQQDLVREPQLAGTWATANREVTLVFKPTTGKAYDLTFTQKRKTDHFEARLLWLGNHLFMDTYPVIHKNNFTQYYPSHFVPVHQFSKVTLAYGTLKLEFANLEYLAKQDGQASPAGEGSGQVLATPTQDLQTLMMRHADDDKAFTNPLGPLVRRPE